jgi:diphosphomevalonate decarboxylase
VKPLQKNDIPAGFSGSVSWRSPSNLAIIKYWGKHGVQLPGNASVSFTLSEAVTETSVTYRINAGGSDHPDLKFSFEGKPQPAFESRIKKFLDSITDAYFPMLTSLSLDIDSRNSFPHSSGIASSASAMSALALCLTDIEYQAKGMTADEAFYRKASEISRLGSGSACRSIYPYMALWGVHPDITGSSNQYAIPYEAEIHEVFKGFHDDILIISSTEKSVSSSAGHQLMNGNIYADTRYRQAGERMSALKNILKAGDVSAFGKIAEDEALTLHALMMCSDPSYILMEENTLTAIRAIRAFRQDTGINVYFSLDAGPNIHLLYPDSDAHKLSLFINDILRPLCHNGRIIHDKAGKGPEKIN